VICEHAVIVDSDCSIKTNQQALQDFVDVIVCRRSKFGRLNLSLIAHSMSALGQKQPLKADWILASERLLSGHTGHSPLRISGDASGCVRPKADGSTLGRCVS